MQTSETAIQFLINYSFFFISYIVIIYFHEAGHYFTAKTLKLKTDGFRVKKLFYIIPTPTGVKVRFEDKDRENIKKYYVKYAFVITNGVLAGIIPLGIYLYYLDSLIVAVVYGCLYIFMSSNDLTRLIKLFTEKDPIDDYEEVKVTVHIPETEEECLSVYPGCKTCGYFILKECPGDKSIFPDKFKPSDLERISTTLKEMYD